MDELNIASVVVSSIGAVISIISLWLVIIISKKQNGQLQLIKKLQQSLHEKVLGSLPNFEAVSKEIVNYLERANEDDNSKVWMMAYWLWFGADQAFPGTSISNLDRNDSEIRELIGTRVQHDRETFIVVYDPREARQDLIRFVKAVLKYQWEVQQGNEDPIPFNDQNVEDLVERYARELETMENDARQNAPKVKIHKVTEIPLITFAVQSRSIVGGLLYLAETKALERKAKTGGLHSRDPELIEIIINQVYSSV